MPYCSQCGTQVRDADVYCGRCGSRQPVGQDPQSRPEAQPRPAAQAPPRPEAPPPPPRPNMARPGGPPPNMPPPNMPPPYMPRANGPACGADLLGGISARTASILCYVPGIGWLVAIVVLAADKFRHNRAVRFHAFQGLYLFVAWLMAGWVLTPVAAVFSPHFAIHKLAELVLLGMSIFMMVKASHDEVYSLPVFGELANRSVIEH